MDRPQYISGLLSALEQEGLLVSVSKDQPGLHIRNIVQDSREVEAGDLFVAVRGVRSDGHAYVADAVRRGAVAVVHESGPTRVGECLSIEVTDSRRALAQLAVAYFDNPSHKLQLIGITGTNGKTTTAYLVHHFLTELGERTGLIGTIEWRTGAVTSPARLTTPDALELNRLLSEMANTGCKRCVIEVSSHALEQERVAGTRFGIGLFTNLTHDHLDYHQTTSAYFAAKKRLFDGLSTDATAITNIDDPFGVKIVADTQAEVHTYGTSSSATYTVHVRANRVEGLEVNLNNGNLRSHLAGAFNAYNIAAAYSVGRSLGIDSNAILRSLSTAPPVPGRLERMVFDSGVVVIVDYAHTPDALKSVLAAAREFSTEGRLWCVFGCGGDRDRGKRARMGRIAEEHADEVVVTSDNPRSEDPTAILADIGDGMRSPENATWIVDRDKAIQHAAQHAVPGDLVVIAGKGHETYQVVNGRRTHFDDREQARTWFNQALD